MRIRTVVVVSLLLALAMAGCGANNDGDKIATVGGQRSGASSATGSAKNDRLSPQEMGVKFAQCMRENGVPDFPDPQINNGTMGLLLPDSVDKQKAEAAQKKCKQYLPNGGETPKGDPQMVEQIRKFAQCMRENGVPNFPDPDDSGSIRIGGDGLSPDDPKMKAAQQTCSKYMPAAPAGGQAPKNKIGSQG